MVERETLRDLVYKAKAKMEATSIYPRPDLALTDEQIDLATETIKDEKTKLDAGDLSTRAFQMRHALRTGKDHVLNNDKNSDLQQLAFIYYNDTQIINAYLQGRTEGLQEKQIGITGEQLHQQLLQTEAQIRQLAELIGISGAAGATARSVNQQGRPTGRLGDPLHTRQDLGPGKSS